MTSLLRWLYLFLLGRTVFGLCNKLTKICIECKHFLPNNGDPKFGKCRAFTLEDLTYMIDGKESVEEYYYCSTARNYDTLCGKDATSFIPKPYRKRSIPPSK